MTTDTTLVPATPVTPTPAADNRDLTIVDRWNTFLSERHLAFNPRLGGRAIALFGDVEVEIRDTPKDGKLNRTYSFATSRTSFHLHPKASHDEVKAILEAALISREVLRQTLVHVNANAVSERETYIKRSFTEKNYDDATATWLTKYMLKHRRVELFTRTIRYNLRDLISGVVLLKVGEPLGLEMDRMQLPYWAAMHSTINELLQSRETLDDVGLVAALKDNYSYEYRIIRWYWEKVEWAAGKQKITGSLIGYFWDLMEMVYAFTGDRLGPVASDPLQMAATLTEFDQILLDLNWPGTLLHMERPKRADAPKGSPTQKVRPRKTPAPAKNGPKGLGSVAGTDFAAQLAAAGEKLGLSSTN